MNEDRIETVVQRIESALARIADVADNGVTQSDDASSEAEISAQPSVTALVEKHEALRETVSNTLEELTELIGEIEQ